MRTLESCGVSDLEHAGISDIARRGRKVAGAATYRNHELVFYQAIVNVAGEPALLARYLKHPSRSPAYRAGRAYTDFVTSLHAEGFALHTQAFAERLQRQSEKLFMPQGAAEIGDVL